MMLRASIAFLTAALLACTPAVAQSGAKKPKVPAGRDPGGAAVAILGAGVDYRRHEIHRRLARDGEGEMIGWDLIDNDPFPFEAVPPAGLRLPTHAGSGMAELLLREATQSRIIAIRLIDASTSALANALTFTRATPARVAAVLLAAPPAESSRLLIRDFSKSSPNLLLILPASLAEQWSRDLTPVDLPGVISVNAATPGGADNQFSSAPLLPGADIAVSTPAHLAPDTKSSDPTGHIALTNAGVVRMAALAARILHAEPKLDANALRQRILSLAKPRLPNSGQHSTPWIENIERLP